ncbi:MAG TPA: TolC family protein [bacterium]|nr:TolC family protein [bacterium]
MKWAGLMIAVIMFTPLYAADKITEIEVAEAVVGSNPGVEAARHAYEGAVAASKTSWFLPNPMAGIEYMGMADRTADFGSAPAKVVEVSQKIPFPLKYPFMIGAANEAVNAARFRHETERRMAGLKAFNAYASFYRVKNEIEITREAAASLLQVSRIASARYGRGSEAQADAAIADLEYAVLENELLSLETEAGVTAAYINSLAGNAITITADAVPEAPALEELPGTLEELITAAVENSPEVLMMEAEMKEAENERNGAFMGFLPDVNIKFRKQVEPGSDNYSIMFEAKLPAWFLTNDVPVARKAGSEYESRKKRYEDKRAADVFEAKKNYEAVKTFGRTIGLYGGILIPRAEAVFEAAVADYRSGKGEFMKVIDSQRKLLEMRRDYYMYVEKYVMNYRELMACCAVSFLRDGKVYNLKGR